MKTKFSGYKGAALWIPVFIIALLISAGCSKKNDNYGTGSGTGSGPGANEVWMKNTAFDPATIIIAVNGTVTWTNKDSFSHDVMADDNSFSSGTMGAGGTFSHQFTTAGTYKYKCTFHPGMTGTVVVQ